jgi:membrane associated rhomboid family serine protease
MPYLDRTFRFGLGGGMPPITRNLLIANAAIWLLSLFFKPFLFEIFALHPNAVINDLAVWQLFTYMFLHGSFFHLFFNMFFGLWMFGREIERTLGSRYFLRFYILTGIGGGFFQLIANWGSSIPIVGASGAIYGILTAFAVLFPHRIITLLLFFIFPVQLKARTFVLIFIGISLALGFQSQVFGTADGVAHFAHLGGAFVGLVILRGHAFYREILRRIAQTQQKRRYERERQRQMRIQQKRRDIDSILDRINEIGYENISQEEKQYLKQASEFLSNEDKTKS